MSGLHRLIRHLIAPLVIWAVEAGWLPAFAQHDVTEALAIALALALPLAWSWARERVEWLP